MVLNIHQILKYFVSLLIICAFSFCNSNCKYKYIDGGVSKSEAEFILKKHNNLRELIANGKVHGQPKGTNLKKLKWDAKLAQKAQSAANTCIYGHVAVNDSRWYVGQNLYRERSTKFDKTVDWDTPIQLWFDEHEKYRHSDRIRVKGTGHYTQIVWATTEYIGCGYTYFETSEKLKYQKIYVCYYGPGGNIRGVLPYKTGKSGCVGLC